MSNQEREQHIEQILNELYNALPDVVKTIRKIDELPIEHKGALYLGAAVMVEHERNDEVVSDNERLNAAYDTLRQYCHAMAEIDAPSKPAYRSDK